MEPQEQVCCYDNRKCNKKRNCLAIVAVIILVSLAVVIGIIIGALASEAILAALASVIVLAVVLGLLLILTIILIVKFGYIKIIIIIVSSIPFILYWQFIQNSICDILFIRNIFTLCPKKYIAISE